MLCIGKVINTHGIKGEIRILSNFKQKKEVFQSGNRLYIDGDKLIINTHRIHKNYDMVTFNNINNINDVLKYKGKPVYIDRNEYTFNEILNEDLIGLQVFGNGKLLGQLEAIENTSKQEILIIKNGTKKIMIPYVSEFVKKITKEKIEVNLIKGMIE